MGYLQPAALLHGSHNAFACLSKNLLSKLGIIHCPGKDKSPTIDETISRPAKRQIPILDMLTHTSGLIYEFTGTTRFIVTIGVTA